VDPHRLAEARSLALHREIARRIEGDPALIDEARRRVEAWEQEGKLHPRYAAAWRRLLEGPRPALLAALVEDGEEARSLRQCTPFPGTVPARERWRIWREVRAAVEKTG
jgi:hypothetical protein